jgi:hypothetical protein
MHRAHKNSFSSQKCPINSSPPKIRTPLAKMGASRARDNHDHPEQHISEEPNPTIVDEWSIRKQIQVGTARISTGNVWSAARLQGKTEGRGD